MNTLLELNYALAVYDTALSEAHQKVRRILPVGSIIRVTMAANSRIEAVVTSHNVPWQKPSTINVRNLKTGKHRTVYLSLDSNDLEVVSVPDVEPANG